MLFYSSYKYVKMIGSLFVLIETCFITVILVIKKESIKLRKLERRNFQNFSENSQRG
jgi:hypothetical protein